MPPMSMAAELSLGRHTPTITQTLSFLRAGVKPESLEQIENYWNVLEFYLKALEDERQKIEAFKRELPFCIQLLDDAIKSLREQVADRLTSTLAPSLQLTCKSDDTGNLLGQKPGPEEFMLFKRKWEKKDEEIEEQQHQAKRATRLVEQQQPLPGNGALGHRNSEWPWNGESDSHSHEKDSSPTGCRRQYEAVKTELVEEGNVRLLAGFKESKLKGAFTPFGKEGPALVTDEGMYAVDASFSKASKEGLMVDACQAGRPSESNEPLKKEGVSRSSCSGQPQRKARRCWSPELHQRFLNALQQLGGSQVATPKQIRELMNVEGLTNDEVKSHLQKFRLHMRRPSPVPQSETQQGPHLVVFGGIWVPPEYGNHSSVGPPQALGQSNLIPPPLLPQDFFSHLSPSRQIGLHGSGYQEYRQSNVVCHNLMQEPPPQLRYTTSQDQDEAESSEEGGRSESSSLNTRKQVEDKERRDSSEQINVLLSKETQQAGATVTNEILGWHDPYLPMHKDYTSQLGSSSAKVGLQNLVGPPLHLSCGVSTYHDRDDQEVSTEGEAIKPDSRTCKDLQDHCSVRKNNSRSGNVSEMRRKSETDLSIGCG